MNIIQCMQVNTTTQSRLPPVTSQYQLPAIPYKLKPTIKINLPPRELCLNARLSLDRYQQRSLLCLIARVRRESVAVMLAIDSERMIPRVTRACLRKVMNVRTVEVKF